MKDRRSEGRARLQRCSPPLNINISYIVHCSKLLTKVCGGYVQDVHEGLAGRVGEVAPTAATAGGGGGVGGQRMVSGGVARRGRGEEVLDDGRVLQGGVQGRAALLPHQLALPLNLEFSYVRQITLALVNVVDARI